MKTPTAESHEYPDSQGSSPLLWIHDTAGRLSSLLSESAFFIPVVWTQPAAVDWGRTIAVIPAGMRIRPGTAGVIRYGTSADFYRAAALGMQDYLHLDCSAAELEFRVRRHIGAETAHDAVQPQLHDNCVLTVLRQNSGSTVERSVLLQLLGAPAHSRCVDMAISRLRGRLQGSAEQIRTVRGVGYILETVVDNL